MVEFRLAGGGVISSSMRNGTVEQFWRWAVRAFPTRLVAFPLPPDPARDVAWTGPCYSGTLDSGFLLRPPPESPHTPGIPARGVGLKRAAGQQDVARRGITTRRFGEETGAGVE